MALTDTDIHVPPTSGPDAYNSDIRPGIGGTYEDTTFGETVMQLSEIGAANADEDMYSHCLSNADGTMYIARSAATLDLQIRSTATAGSIASQQPDGSSRADCMWHPTDPDLYFFFSGQTIQERSIAGLSNSSIRPSNGNFGATVQPIGGSVNWVSKDGNIFAVKYSNLIHVYNRADDVVYSGTPAEGIGGNGWAAISPDGLWLVILDSDTDKHHAYPLNHTTHTIGSRIMPWDTGGGHSLPVSGSDGQTYLVAPSQWGGVHLATIDRDREAVNGEAQKSDTGVTQLLHDEFVNTWDLHMAHGPIGDGQDWYFITPECTGSSGIGRDNINDVPGTNNVWNQPYKQEVVAQNYLTGAVRRLAYHRSRSIAADYYRQPRPSCSWDSSFVLWASNFNDGTPAGYSDIYGILNPLGVVESSGSRNTFLRLG